MRYLSVCSGIEAASVAWHDLGWTPAAFSEIEPFPSAVLAHHYPDIPNVGDMTKFKEWNLGSIDLLVGGTPCQSFSVAGLRKGLDDPRGNLMLTFLAIAERERPRWIVWENVPGVLSSNGGRDFGTFLAALGELGYGWAYRVLDAQWFGVAQRRRRVFVVGCLGDQASAAAVLFESESVRRNPAPSREARQGVAASVGGGPDGGGIPEVAQTLSSRDHKGPSCGRDGLVGNPIAVPVAHAFKIRGGVEREDGSRGSTNIGKQAGKGYLGSEERAFTLAAAQDQFVAQPIGFGAQMSVPQTDIDLMQTLQAKNPMAVAQPVAYGIDGEQNASEELIGTLRSHQSGGYEGARVAQPIAIQGTLIGRGDTAGPQGNGVDERGSMFTLTKTDVHAVAQPMAMAIRTANTKANGHGIAVDVTHTLDQAQGQAVAQPVAFKVRGGVEVDSAGKAAGKGYLGSEETAFTLAATQDQWLAAPPAMQVRRLTPVECERLQGFPDGYTNIPWRKKDEATDGPRYKALGNSMAVPCMKWIGERIQAAVERQEVPR